MNKDKWLKIGMVALSIVADVAIELKYRSIDYESLIDKSKYDKVCIEKTETECNKYVYIPKGIISE